MKKLLPFVLLLATQFLFTQEHARVHFTDKEDVAMALADPITILTRNAIDRKNLHGMSIDERDVSVNENYVAAVEAAERADSPGVDVINTSLGYSTFADPDYNYTTQEKLKHVSIYPNPVKTYFEIGYPSSIGDLKVEVYNILGKKVITQNITPENKTVNASKLSKGVYMIRISSEKGIKILKIVKQ